MPISTVHRIFISTAVTFTAASQRLAYGALARPCKTQPGKGRQGAAALQKWRRSEVGDIIFYGIPATAYTAAVALIPMFAFARHYRT